MKTVFWCPVTLYTMQLTEEFRTHKKFAMILNNSNHIDLGYDRDDAQFIVDAINEKIEREKNYGPSSVHFTLNS